MSDVIIGAAFWQVLKAMIPNLPAETASVTVRVTGADDPVMVDATFAATTEGGDLKIVGDSYLVLAERFALIPWGATRPPEEREAFIAELIAFIREAAAVSGYDSPTPGELEDISTRAAALIAKHEGRS